MCSSLVTSRIGWREKTVFLPCWVKSSRSSLPSSPTHSPTYEIADTQVGYLLLYVTLLLHLERAVVMALRSERFQISASESRMKEQTEICSDAIGK